MNSQSYLVEVVLFIVVVVVVVVVAAAGIRIFSLLFLSYCNLVMTRQL